jgi:peroxiredoxin (alkyl hydroperoxide reductase subunit C)
MKYLIHEDCPDFTASALMPNGELNNAFNILNYFGGHYGVIFFYPLDFNYISRTELLSIQKRIGEFNRLNIKVVALSCDSYLAHRAWQVMSPVQEGLGPVDFPLVSDMTRTVARMFDVLVADAIPEAATIIVDGEGKIIFQLRHDTSVGRNIDRVLEAITTFLDPRRAPTAPFEQILLVEQTAPKLRQLGFNIVAQSLDTSLDHPQWKMLPRDAKGNITLSFPFLAGQQTWPKHEGFTVAIREGLTFHSTGLLMPDGQLLFEHHSDRYVPRDFSEIIRLADAIRHHMATGEVVPWEKPV